MANDLYFIPILARTLQAPDPRVALREAFAEIQEMGKRPECRRGFDQFRRFMAAVQKSRATAASAESENEALIKRLILELATETFRGDPREQQMALEIIRSRPEWRGEYERIVAELHDHPPAAKEWEFTVKRGNAVVEKLRLDRSGGVASVGGLRPGVFSLHFFETGRLLWQRTLEESDLLWAAAFPNEPLRLAADIGGGGNRPTLEERLLDGEVTIRVFAGFECGQMEIELRPVGELEAKK